MGKFSRKVARDKVRQQGAVEKKEVSGLEAVMTEQVKNEQYLEALDSMAKLAGHNCQDPEVMYLGAVCYFMTGDYDRAAKWVDNTLSYAPAHVKARILLARICIAKERTGDGLTVVDFILENEKAVLEQTDEEALEELLEYYVRSEPEKIRERYPHIAEFMKMPWQAETDNPLAKAQEAIAALKGKMEAGTEKVRAKAAETDNPLAKAQEAIAALKGKMEAGTEEVRAKAEIDNPLAKAQEAIAALKGKMEAGAEKVRAKAAETDNPLAKAQEAIAALKDKMQAEPAKAVCTEEKETTAEDVLASLCTKQMPLLEKIKICNAFAGSYYYQGDFVSASLLLEEALQLDSSQPATLRNLACTAYALGNLAKAQEYASQMPFMDFLLLDKLRQ